MGEAVSLLFFLIHSCLCVCMCTFMCTFSFLYSVVSLSMQPWTVMTCYISRSRWKLRMMQNVSFVVLRNEHLLHSKYPFILVKQTCSYIWIVVCRESISLNYPYSCFGTLFYLYSQLVPLEYPYLDYQYPFWSISIILSMN